jgi:hypothetical protein
VETTSRAGATAALPWSEGRALPWVAATKAPFNLLRFILTPPLAWPKKFDWFFSSRTLVEKGVPVTSHAYLVCEMYAGVVSESGGRGQTLATVPHTA